MRFRNSILNMISELIPQLILMVIGFIKISMFISLYGHDVNGFNLTITQIIAYLALVEGGFGIALTQALFKPLAEGNQQKIKELYLGGEKILHIIAAIILILSVVVGLFLPNFTKGVFSNWYTVLAFFIVVIPTVFSYFLMAPTLVVIADQKNYKVNTILKTLAITRGLAQLLFMYLKWDYLTLVIVDGVVIFLQYYLSRQMAFKEYPYLKQTKGLKPDMTALENTKSLLVHKIAYIIKSSSSNIILLGAYPGTIGLTLSSIFGNYYYIISMFIQILGGVLNAPKESFGNLLHTEKERVYDVFKEYLSLGYFISTIICVVTFVTINDFMPFWLHENAKTQTLLVVFCFCYILFEAMVRIPIHNIRDAAGLFKESRKYAVLEAILNIIIAIVLVKQYQIAGILMATVTSSIVSGFILNPNLVYRTIFNRSLFTFFKDISRQVIYLVIIGLLTYGLWNYYLLSFANSLIMWFIMAGVTFVLTSLVTLALYYLTIASFKSLFLRIFGKVVQRFIK